MRQPSVFGFEYTDDPPDWSDCNVALVDALREYLRRLELDNEAYEEDYRAEYGTAPPIDDEDAARKWQEHLQTAKLLLKQIEDDEVYPQLIERLKR